MRFVGLGVGAATLMAMQALATQVTAADARFERSLQRLDPEERLEQLCDYTAMAQIRNDNRSFRPDRAVANAMADAHVSQDTIKATAGAFRSGGKWFTLAYSCTATPDHLKVISFQYSIGPEIPGHQMGRLRPLGLM